MKDTKELNYLHELSDEEFRAVTGLVKRHGVKVLLGTVMDIARYQATNQSNSEAEQARAARVLMEMEGLIERLEGFEELGAKA